MYPSKITSLRNILQYKLIGCIWMKTGICLSLIVSIISSTASSTENSGTDEDQVLVESCQAITNPEQVDAKACIYFILGFLAAAQTIDPPVIKNKGQKERKFYGFMSRPYRNWDLVQPTRFFPFCVPENELNARVIEVVSKRMSPQFDTAKALKKVILNALNTEYPCGKANQN